MKPSVRFRSMKLLGLAAKVGREEMLQSLKDAVSRGVDEVKSGRAKTRIEQAKLIAENLSQLKGAAMKAGQLLSLDASDLLPPEALEILAKLQNKADPVDFAIMEQVLLEDLGSERRSDFSSLNPNPAASASIGQVHRAQLFGKDVAVKIQYPGVADSIDSDLRILKSIAQSFFAVTGRKIDLDDLFTELSEVLKQEADYDLELKNMAEYRALLGSFPDYKVPEPIASHSKGRVLTMSWQEGIGVLDWLKLSPSMEARTQIAKLVLDLYCKEFFEWGLVQTDPNYANYLVEPQAPKLILLDFGATLRYSPEFRGQYVSLLKVLSSLDHSKIIRSFTEFGLLDERENTETKELFVELLKLSLEPFQPHLQPFRFRDADYSRRSREIGQKFTQSLRFTPPPRRILFLHRKLGGIFNLLKKLDVQLDLRPYWDQMVGRENPR